MIEIMPIIEHLDVLPRQIGVKFWFRFKIKVIFQNWF